MLYNKCANKYINLNRYAIGMHVGIQYIFSLKTDIKNLFHCT